MACSSGATCLRRWTEGKASAGELYSKVPATSARTTGQSAWPLQALSACASPGCRDCWRNLMFRTVTRENGGGALTRRPDLEVPSVCTQILRCCRISTDDTVAITRARGSTQYSTCYSVRPNPKPVELLNGRSFMHPQVLTMNHYPQRTSAYPIKKFVVRVNNDLW